MVPRKKPKYVAVGVRCHEIIGQAPMPLTLRSKRMAARTTNHRIAGVFPLPALFIGICLKTTLAKGDERGPSGPRAITVEEADRSEWTVPTQAKAVSGMSKITGLTEATDQPVHAKLVMLEQDNTPYLSNRLIGRPLWHVEVRNVALKLESSPPGYKDAYVRTLDVFLDPLTGQMLKVKSRWPAGVAPIAPEPSAEFAVMQMLGSDKEIYHGFPDVLPPISFLEALDAIQKGGGVPMGAKQIEGCWVVWSEFDRTPRPMWVITLRGIALIEASYPGVPVDSRNHLRYIVDPVAKRWVNATTIPQPEKRQGE